MSKIPTDAALGQAALGLTSTFRETLIGHGDPELQSFVEGLASVREAPLQAGPKAFSTAPAIAHLEPLLAKAGGDPALIAAVKTAARAFNWGMVFEGDGIEPGLAAGLMASQAAGSYGVFASEQIATGLFLLGPGIEYPLHNHAAREIYYCVSGTLTLRHGTTGTPFQVSAGEYSVTPEHRLHALNTGDEPVLLIYAWTGELICPNWWWDRDSSGAWQRTEWRRFPKGAWQAIRSEAVTDAMMAQAHD